MCPSSFVVCAILSVCSWYFITLSKSCVAPGMFSVDAFVTADGNMTVKLNGAFDGVVVCQVQYRLSNDRIENKITTRDPPASTINVTGLLNTVLYQVSCLPVHQE